VVNVYQSHFGWNRALHIEQGIPKWRCQERYLQVDCNHDNKPNWIKTQLSSDRQKDREGDINNGDPVNEKAHNEDYEHHDPAYAPLSQDAELPYGSRYYIPATQTEEYGGKYRGPDNDCHDHTIGSCRRPHTLQEPLPGKAPIDDHKNEGNEGAYP